MSTGFFKPSPIAASSVQVFADFAKGPNVEKEVFAITSSDLRDFGKKNSVDGPPACTPNDLQALTNDFIAIFGVAYGVFPTKLTDVSLGLLQATKDIWWDCDVDSTFMACRVDSDPLNGTPSG